MSNVCLYDQCENLEELLAQARCMGLSPLAGPGERQPCRDLASACEFVLAQLCDPIPGVVCKDSPLMALEKACDAERVRRAKGRAA